MKNFRAVISIHSSYDSVKPRPIYIEPWGEDYWLFPGNEFEISAIGNESPPYFSVVENDDSTQIYIEGDCQDFSVQHGENIIKCGYQRAKLVGQVEHAFTIIGRGLVITSKGKWLENLKVEDEIRLLIPKVKTLNARILGFEHINTGRNVEKENPFGLFLGKINFEAHEINSSTLVYRLETLR